MTNNTKYLLTMTMVKNLLSKGIITEEEYDEIDTIFKQKYGKCLSTIMTDISLIKLQNRVNM